MTTAKLEWRSTDYDRSKVLVKGTELATAIVPGTLSRFQICAIRAWDEASKTMTGEVYHVRDADTVSDADVKAGVRPKVVAVYADLDEAIAFCTR